MERVEAAVCVFSAEHLQRGAFGGRGKGKEGKILVPAVGKHLLNKPVLPVDFVLGLALNFGILPQRFLGIGQRGFQLQGGSSGLRRMRLIHDDGVVPAPCGVHLLIDDRELLQRGDDNARPRIERVPQIPAVFVFPDGLHRAQRVVETGDGLLQLRIQHGPVGHDNNAGKNGLVVLVVQGSQPVGRPGDGIRLAGTGGMLNQVVVARAVFGNMGHHLPHRVKLVIARKYQAFLFDDLFRAVGLELLFLRDLQMDELLQDIHHAVLLENILPEIGRRIPFRIGGISLAAVPSRAAAALVERQKNGVLACKLRGHPHFRVIHGKAAQNPFVELEAGLAGIAVVHPLRLGVIHGLAGVLVLQLKGENGDAVQDKHHIHALVATGTVMPLPVAGHMIARILLRRRLV